MEDVVAHGAVRRVSIDVANLTGQLALLQSAVEFVHQVASGIDPDHWERVMGEDAGGNPEVHIKMRGEQADAVMRVLAALDSLG